VYSYAERTCRALNGARLHERVQHARYVRELASQTTKLSRRGPAQGVELSEIAPDRLQRRLPVFAGRVLVDARRRVVQITELPSRVADVGGYLDGRDAVRQQMRRGLGKIRRR
jgi:hypothetical protein